jgi:Tol biopolymer transport system component
MMMSTERSMKTCLLLAAVAATCSPTSFAQERTARVWTPAAVASDQYEATPTFTPDGREMYFMLSDPRFERYRLMWSRCENGAWSTPTPAPFAAAGVQEGDPGITPDGKRLYFISMRHDPKREDFDIWYVERTRGDAWGTPQRLPEPVSSPGAELLPRTDGDGRLFFGSDRAGGFGQGDIYVATQAGDGKWSVRNVGPPVSTAAYEYEAEISQDGRTLIAVIDRGDRSHLYRFESDAGRWVERGRVPAYANVFQVGPLLSPTADRLLFAQAQQGQSGEFFLIDLAKRPDERWPACSQLRARDEAHPFARDRP